MYIATSHRPTTTEITVDLTLDQYIATLGEFTVKIGDATIHLTADEADRLAFQLTTAIQDRDLLKESA